MDLIHSPRINYLIQIITCSLPASLHCSHGNRSEFILKISQNPGINRGLHVVASNTTTLAGVLVGRM